MILRSYVFSTSNTTNAPCAGGSGTYTFITYSFVLRVETTYGRTYSPSAGTATMSYHGGDHSTRKGLAEYLLSQRPDTIEYLTLKLNEGGCAGWLLDHGVPDLQH